MISEPELPAVYAACLRGKRRAIIPSVCVMCPSKLNDSDRADRQDECHGPSHHVQSGDCHDGQHCTAWVGASRETRNRRGARPRGGVGRGRRPADQSKVPWEPEPCGSLMKGILTTAGTAPWRCSRCFELWTRRQDVESHGMHQ